MRLATGFLAGIVLMLPRTGLSALTPPFQRAPYTIDALGIAAQRDSGGFFRIPSRGMEHLIVWIGPGARLIMDFSRPFADGPGNDFAILTSPESWGALAGTGLFEFWLNDVLVGSLATDLLRPGELLAFEMPGESIIANRIILVNTTTGPPGSAMAFVDAGVAYSVDAITLSPLTTTSTPSRQTGLFLERIRITNDTPELFAALRVWVRLDTNSVDRGVEVWNAAGRGDGVPFLLHNQTLNSGQSVDLVTEYYIPDRRTIPSALYLTEVISTEPAPIPEGASLTVDRVLWLEGNEVLVEFPTESGRTYYVQYGLDLATWKTALPAVVGTGSRVQWIDHGPPKTESLPANDSARFYRVVTSPSP